MPKLIITEKGSDNRRTVEFGHEGISIGRSEENNVRLASAAVSRKHANIVVSGGNCFLIDLGSDNGTFLNGLKLSPNEQNILRHGDVISIENYNLTFSMIDEMLASSFNEVTDSDIMEVKLLKKVLKAIDKEKVPSIEVLNGNFIGKKFFISDDIEEITIGRDDSADFQIEEYVISRAHARITREGNELYIKDLGSKNGTYLNNRRIDREMLHDGDRIALGTIVLIFRDPNEVKMEDISVKARKVEPLPAAAAKRPPKRKNRSDDELEVERPEDAAEDLTAEGSDYEPFGDVPEKTPDDNYPIPRPRKEIIRMSMFEMGMIGIGAVIFIFAIISFINLISK